MDGKLVIHIDMDAFYASIEQRDNPQYKGKALVVGGRSGRGVVSAASYEARKYGIHSAMSMERARQLCDDLITIPSNMAKYKEESVKLFNILKNYTDLIEKISIDEAFLVLDRTNIINKVNNIKKDIYRRLGLTASVGISHNKFLAKLASDMKKPDGLTLIKREEAVEILKPLPISKIIGIGPKMELELNKLGIYYIVDIQNYSPDILEEKFGKKGREIYYYSYGVDYREVISNEPIQSIGEEETFLEDTKNKEILYKKINYQSLNVAKRAEKHGVLARTITVKVKYYDFQVETRSLTISIPTRDYQKIWKISKYILDTKFNIDREIRLIGVSLSNLIYPEDPHQLSLTEL